MGSKPMAGLSSGPIADPPPPQPSNVPNRWSKSPPFKFQLASWMEMVENVN